MRRVVKAIMAFGMITFIVQLAIMLFSLVYGIHIVLPELPGRGFIIYVIAPVLVQVGTLSGDVLTVYYLLLVAAIVMSAAWVFLRSAKEFHKELTMNAEPRKHSQIYDVCSLMFAVLFLNMVVVLLTMVFWEEPISPVEEVEVWELLFLLANASVWEELVVRVLLIGIPLFFIDHVRRMPREKLRSYLLGGGFKFGSPEVTLVIFSSVLFGFGHLEGWGAWKVFPTAVAGVAFGYLFMKHGLPAAILLHFSFDYLSIPLELFTDSSDLGIILIFALATFLWIGMGLAFFVYYIVRISEFLTKKEYFNDPQYTPRPVPYGPVPVNSDWRYGQQHDMHRDGEIVHPPPGIAYSVQRPGGLFICPVCGNTEARWLDSGKFQCLRCGALV